MRISRFTDVLLIATVVCPLAAVARIGETPEESQKRYGAPVPAAEVNVILPGVTNQVYTYEGWQITAAYVDAKTARIRYRKGRTVEEASPVEKEAGPLNERQAKKRAAPAKLNRNNKRADKETVPGFKEAPLSSDEIKTILKSESPVGNWREYDPKTQSHNAVFSFAEKAFPPKLINDFGIVAHVTLTSVTLEKLAAVQELEKPPAAPKGAAPAIPKF